MALHYHLPGYWDGQFVIPIEKSPIHFLDSGHSGADTAQPQGVLIVQSAAQKTAEPQASIKSRGLQIVLPEAQGTPSPGVRISGGKGDNAKIELRNSGSGTPHIDFVQQLGEDYDARLRLVAPKRLMLEGASPWHWR